jgi:hypothetical protein
MENEGKMTRIIRYGCWFTQPDARNGLHVAYDPNPYVGQDGVLVEQNRWCGDEEKKKIDISQCYDKKEQAEEAYAEIERKK